MASLSYPKSVRLHHRKAFQALLDKGSTHYNAVFKVFWLVRDSDSNASSINQVEILDECSRFAVSVPKKSFKRAVKRNLLKRRIREAIRLNRRCLPEGFCADFLFFYRVGEVLDYAAIEKAVVDAFTSIPTKNVAKAEREAESETSANCNTEKPAGDE